MNEGNTQLTMPVQPMYGGFGGGFNNGFGFGGDFSWILLLILLCGGNWGGFGGFGGWGAGMMGMGMGMMDGGFGLYPWLNNSEHISDGFRDQQLSTQISGLRSDVTGGFADTALGIAGVNQNICQTGSGIQNTLCQGFAGNVAAINGAQNALAQQMYTNQIADLERSYAAQTANTAALTALQAQQADCCCKTQTGIADTRYTIATEACATRNASATNTRDIIDSQTRGTQAILDKLCQLELDGYKSQIESKNDTIAQLRSQLQFSNMQASQVDQTAQLRANQATVANQLVSELRSCPIPAQPVYGNQPIFTCNGNNGYSCGCNGNNGFIG